MTILKGGVDDFSYFPLIFSYIVSVILFSNQNHLCICSFSVKYAALRRKSNDWLHWVGIRIMYLSGVKQQLLTQVFNIIDRCIFEL
jgi:hypothetical protein